MDAGTTEGGRIQQVGRFVAAALLSTLVLVAMTGAQAASAATPNSVEGFGSAASIIPSTPLDASPASIASTPDGNGFWTVDSEGQVSAQGDAVDFGSVTQTLNAPIVGMAATPDGSGYWLVGSDGGIFTFGDAGFYGSAGDLALNQPIVGMAATSDGAGYWLVAADGGIFNYGDAGFYGSTGAMTLNAPIVGIAATPDGAGYWLVAADGGIFGFGNANFFGSAGGLTLDAPIVGMASTPDGGGYWLVGADGGIFSFGDADFYGADSGKAIDAPASSIAARPLGYWVAYGGFAPISTPLGQEQRLAQLGYLPLTWSPAGFTWRWGSIPPSLAALWNPGNNNEILIGALYALESVWGLPLDGQINPAETNALASAVQVGDSDPNGYTYAYVTQTLPESLTVWHNGVVVESTPANTAVDGLTEPGNYPVYLRLRNQVMTGTNLNGSHYADPVQFVAYFHGGDALHYMPRATYGHPQSLGCVELPYGAAETIWPYTSIGTLVTVN